MGDLAFGNRTDFENAERGLIASFSPGSVSDNGGRVVWDAGGMAAGLAVEQVFDSMAIRVNGPEAWDEHLTIDWHFTDAGAITG